MTKVLLLVICLSFLASEAFISKQEPLFNRFSNVIFDESRIPDFHTRSPEKRSIQNSSVPNIPISPWQYSIISWAFISNDRVIALSSSFYLLVSENSLMTFQRKNDIPATDQCYEVAVSENKTRVFLSGLKASWVSTDGGYTWEKRPKMTSFGNLVFHPTDENWIIAYRYTPNALYLTKDLGKSWTNIATNVHQYDWCHAGHDNVPKERLCMISSKTGFFQYTNNLGGIWNVSLKKEADFFRIHDRFFTLVAEYNGVSDLYVSADYGVTFRRALLPEGIPVGTLSASQFVEDDNGVIWILVHPNPKPAKDTSASGTLYVSDSDGYKFTIALKGVHMKNNVWDIELVKSIEGTLLANVLVAEGKDALLQTKITYDNGHTWKTLQAPEYDSNKNKIKCDRAPCNLNLFGLTGWLRKGNSYGPFYSDKHAVGMIIGTGNVGPFLESNSQHINTYFSRDGGLTWNELMKGSTIYEYGDFGGLLVLADNQNSTDTIYYTLNGGKTFDTIHLNAKAHINNIVITSTVNERFIVMADNYQKFWGVDFSLLHERSCNQSDYELWHPHNGISGPKCVLGHDITYQRRKREASCYTDNGLNHVFKIENCNCTEDDYECDYQFERTKTTNKCAYEGTNLDQDSLVLGCVDGASTYTVSSGYRKIPGDTCTNSLKKYENVVVKICPVNSSSESSGDGIFGIIIGLVSFLVVGGIVGFLFGLRNESFRQKFPWIKAPKWVHIGYSNQLTEDLGDEFGDEGSDLGDITDAGGSDLDADVTADSKGV